MTGHDVVIAGGGPTGLMLAGELALAKVDVAIVERRTSPELVGSRAGGLHSRTIEVLDQRGIADRFLSQGQVAQVAGFAWIRLDISDFPTRHNYGLGLWQKHFERILAGWVGELGVPVYRGREVTGFAQDDTGVDVELADGQSLRSQYLVGCDGGRSLIRKAAGIDFPGWDPSTSCLIAQVEMAEEPEWGRRRDAIGVQSLSRLEDGAVGVLVTERQVGHATEPTLRDLSEALIAVYGTDYGVHSPTSISRFTDMTRQAASYRDRRVLLAGDAAHVHFPVGGQGLNIGVQDAVNLGWKLAQVVKQTSPESLLDTYHAERHPVAARVLRKTMAQTALLRHDDRTEALRDTMSELLSMDEPRQRIAGDDVRPGHSLRPGGGTSAARAPHARSRSGHPRWHGASIHPPPRRPRGPSEPRPALGVRHLPVGTPSLGDRRRICRQLGASGPGPGRSPRCRADPTRWIRRLGGRRHGYRIARRADYLVRITMTRRDARPHRTP